MITYGVGSLLRPISVSKVLNLGVFLEIIIRINQ